MAKLPRLRFLRFVNQALSYGLLRPPKLRVPPPDTCCLILPLTVATCFTSDSQRVSAVALLAAATLAFSGCAKQSTAPRNAPIATPTASPSSTDYAKLRVALLKALQQDAKNRGVPWTHPIETITWTASGIVIIEKTHATKSVGDDCALAIATSTEANQKLTNNLYRQQNDPKYDPQATPVWPVKVQNATGTLMTRYDPNAESGPSC